MAYSLDEEFYCCKCGQKGISIIRIKGKERGAGHLKKIWCLNCREEANHAECKEWTKYTYDDFLLEFNNNNFDEHQQRKLPYGLFRDKLHKEGIL